MLTPCVPVPGPFIQIKLSLVPFLDVVLNGRKLRGTRILDTVRHHGLVEW